MKLFQLLSTISVGLFLNTEAAMTEQAEGAVPQQRTVGARVIPQSTLDDIRAALERQKLWDIYVKHDGDINAIMKESPVLAQRIRTITLPYTAPRT